MPGETPTPDPTIYLQNRTARSGLPLTTRGCIALGLPFFSAGLFVTALGYGLIPSTGAINAPPHIIAGFGAIFWLVGLWMIITGLRRIARTHRIRAHQLRHPTQPWHWDHRWTGTELLDDQRARLWSVTLQTLGIGGFLTPFAVFAWTTPDIPIIFKAITSIFGLVVVGLIIWWTRCLTRCIKFGRTRLRLSTFPVRLGDRLIAECAAGARIRPSGPVSATLRCIQERIVTEETSDGTTTTVKCEQLYIDQLELDVPALGPSVPPLALAFRLPDDPDLASALSEHPARYWGLELACETPGIDFRAAFLLPIYARSDETLANAA